MEYLFILWNRQFFEKMSNEMGQDTVLIGAFAFFAIGGAIWLIFGDFKLPLFQDGSSAC